METIDLFRNARNVTEFAAGTVIFEQGAPADVMYAIIDGDVGVEINGTQVQTFGPGQIVGEMGIIDPTHPPRTATVRALNDARLVPIDEEEFKRLVERVPFFALRVLRIVTERLRDTNKLL